MNRHLKRIASLLEAMLLAFSVSAFAEESEAPDMDMNEAGPIADQEHFVPENPDMAEPRVTLVELDLASCTTPKAYTPADADGGKLFSGGEVNKAMFPLPYQVMKGTHVRLTVTGRFVSDADKGITVYLSNDSMGNCSNATMVDIPNDGSGTFSAQVELIANQPANAVLISTMSSIARFEGLIVDSIVLEADEELMAGGSASVPYAEAVRQPWYADMLKASQMKLGNNKRLHALADRAKAGEHITIATIGGSITEGAGASTYQQCYAYRIYDGLAGALGLDDAAKVSFVNAGVGGTPSTFGWMRYQRDVVDRVKDDDGLPDIVIIEYSVNDGGEPTNHQCFESMVKQILMQPNDPVVIILFAVFPTGYNLQADLRRIGDTYDLMMVSIKDGPFREVGTHWTEDGFFYDIYHPTTLGHAVMANCVLTAVRDSLAEPACEQDIDLNVQPAYGVSYMGIRTIYAHGNDADLALEKGSFSADDTGSYTNLPIGRVCGSNFFHTANAGNEPLVFTATFSNLLIAYRTMNDASYGRADVYIDGVKVRTLNANTGSWGQSVVDLLYASDTEAEHTVTICMAEGDEAKKFTITCLGFAGE